MKNIHRSQFKSISFCKCQTQSEVFCCQPLYVSHHQRFESERPQLLTQCWVWSQRKGQTRKCVLTSHQTFYQKVQHGNLKLIPGTARVNMKVGTWGEGGEPFKEGKLMRQMRVTAFAVCPQRKFGVSQPHAFFLRCMWPERHGVTLDFLWKVEVILWHLDVKDCLFGFVVCQCTVIRSHNPWQSLTRPLFCQDARCLTAAILG